jgi:hypothetical protein
MTTRSFPDFHQDDGVPPENALHVVRIPRGTDDKELLLRLIAAALNFPGYFGFNWDALDECLGDLSWIGPGDVVIWHEDVPLSSEVGELWRYLQVVRNVEQEGGSRSVIISFPESSRRIIEKALN